LQSGSIEISANKDEPAVARLVRSPSLLQIALKQHVDRLEDETPILALHVDDAFGAQDVLPVRRQQLRQPPGDLVAVHRNARHQSDAADFRIVQMVGRISRVVAMLAMAMTRVARVRREKIPLERHDALEIESTAPEHPIERNIRALRTMNWRKRIELS